MISSYSQRARMVSAICLPPCSAELFRRIVLPLCSADLLWQSLWQSPYDRCVQLRTDIGKVGAEFSEVC